VSLEAEELHYEESSGLYTANGNVRLTRGKMSLKADEVRFDSIKKNIVATGHVEIYDGEDTLRAEKIVMNLESQTGAVIEGEIHVSQDNSHIRSKRIEKLGEKSYRLTYGTMTTCDCAGGKPSWALFADDVKVTMGGYAVARDFLFYVKGVPVFYLPYMVFPVKTEQESGLLNPRYVYSTRDGSEFFIPYYQAIAPWMDMTLTPEYFTRRGAGGSLEYRYSLTTERYGGAYARYFNDILINETKKRGRWEGSLRHEDRWGETAWGKVDIHIAGDPAYRSDFGEALQAASQQYTESRVSVGDYIWPGHLIAETLYYQDIYSSLGSRTFTQTTIQRFPRVSLNTFRWVIPLTPVYYDGVHIFENFWSEQKNLGQRVFLSPSLSVPINLKDMIQIVPQAGLFWKGYFTDTTSQAAIPNASLLLSSKVYRVYGNIKHVFEPELSYLFVNKVSQESFPLWDERDRIPSAKTYSASAKNFFVLRDTEGHSREVGQLNLTGLYEDETERSKGIGEIKVKPFPFIYWKLIGEAGFNGEGFTRVTNILDVHDLRRNSFSLSYTYLPGASPVNEINGGIGLNFFDRVGASFNIQYSFIQKVPLQSITGLRYSSGCRCWDLNFTWIHQPNIERYMVLLTLTGLGEIGGGQ